jgi:hypothetical protein
MKKKKIERDPHSAHAPAEMIFIPIMLIETQNRTHLGPAEFSLSTVFLPRGRPHHELLLRFDRSAPSQIFELLDELLTGISPFSYIALGETQMYWLVYSLWYGPQARSSNCSTYSSVRYSA